MRDDQLPSPGIINDSIQLRRIVARAVSGVEVQASRAATGKADQAATLVAFFQAAIAAIEPYVGSPEVAARVASTETTEPEATPPKA